MSNYLRPRYKINFQSKNKVYLNKNSKFRLFYLIRGKFFKRRDGKYRSKIKFKNMKWTVARRFFCSRVRRRVRLRFHYGSSLTSKQQIKKFYGKIREYQFKKLLKNACYLQHKYKQNIFLSNLENRLDIALIRMHLFPTIFMANQFILHKGIYVNNEKSFLPHLKINTGDIVNIDKKYWKIIYKNLIFKLSNRYKGHKIEEKLLRNKNLTQKKRFKRYIKLHQRKNLKLLDELNKIKRTYKNLKVLFFRKKNIKKDLMIKILNQFKILEIKLKYLRNSLMILRKWKTFSYYKGELFIILNYIFIYFLLFQFNFLFRREYFPEEYEYYSDTESELDLVSNTKLSFNSGSDSYTESESEPEIQFESDSDTNPLGIQYDLKRVEIYNLYITKLIKKLLNGTHVIEAQKLRLKEKKIQKINERLVFNNWWCKKPHWYLPTHLEIDYKTLRLSVIENPSIQNISYPFSNSIYKLICFYTDKSFKT